MIIYFLETERLTNKKAPQKKKLKEVYMNKSAIFERAEKKGKFNVLKNFI